MIYRLLNLLNPITDFWEASDWESLLLQAQQDLDQPRCIINQETGELIATTDRSKARHTPAIWINNLQSAEALRLALYRSHVDPHFDLFQDANFALGHSNQKPLFVADNDRYTIDPQNHKRGIAKIGCRYTITSRSSEGGFHPEYTTYEWDGRVWNIID